MPKAKFTNEEAEALAKFGAKTIKVVRYVAGSASPAAYVQTHTDEQFLAVVDIHNLTADALKSLSGQNIIAIVVGHYHGGDAEPARFAWQAADAVIVTRLIRMVSNAPVLLSVSASNWHTKRPEPGWVKAFGEDLAEFDGWAIYNLHNWPAVLESPQNPRERTLKQFDLPDKPCILMDFQGTPSNYPQGKAEYVKAVWKAKTPLLLKDLKTQKWRGLVVYSTQVEDAKMKAAALKTTEEKLTLPDEAGISNSP